MTVMHASWASTCDSSPQPEGERHMRRGFCPGLSAPMQTGDGLLVRLMPAGTITLAAFAALCAAARRHGNGIVEVTSRGNIQVRGLDVESAAPFAASVAALAIAADDGVPVYCNALAGLDAGEIIDAAALAAELRSGLARRRPLAARLDAKVCVAIDGGGALRLGRFAADVRLCARASSDRPRLRVSVGGDDAGALVLGCVAPADGVAVAVRLLEVIARHGRAARARDIAAGGGADRLRAAIADFLLPDRPRGNACPGLDLSSHGHEPNVFDALHLRDGSWARGIGLGFGHADAASLERLIAEAATAGASGLRTAPDRALILLGVTRDAATAFGTAAERLGFISRAGDPRRRITACAGAPICASGHIATRTLAPHLAGIAGRHGDRCFDIHLSGCAKGCAHPAPAALTIVGTAAGCALVAGGTSRQTPFDVVGLDRLAAAVADYARGQTGAR